jgi:putative ABC transport system ATP-binding protein
MLIHMSDIKKYFEMGTQVIRAVDGVDLDIEKNEYVALMGPSGSGKTTFMTIIGCLDTPTSGLYELGGRDVTKLADDDLAHIRNKEIGFVFQTFNLLPRATALQNVELPLIYAGLDGKDRKDRMWEALRAVGLEDRAAHRPNELSGGQRQRVAIARALAAEPRVLILDESVAALDVSIQAQVLNLLADIRDETRISYILISHDLAVVRQLTEETIVMWHGRVVERGPTARVLDDPQDDYTKRLRASVPRPGWKPRRRAALDQASG